MAPAAARRASRSSPVARDRPATDVGGWGLHLVQRSPTAGAYEGRPTSGSRSIADAHEGPASDGPSGALDLSRGRRRTRCARILNPPFRLARHGRRSHPPPARRRRRRRCGPARAAQHPGPGCRPAHAPRRRVRRRGRPAGPRGRPRPGRGGPHGRRARGARPRRRAHAEPLDRRRTHQRDRRPVRRSHPGPDPGARRPSGSRRSPPTTAARACSSRAARARCTPRSPASPTTPTCSRRILAAAKLDAPARQAGVTAPWKAAKAREWDRMSLDDWMRGEVPSEKGRAIFTSACQSIWGADPSELSLLYVLQYVAAAGNAKNAGPFLRLITTGGGAQESRFVGGSQPISEKVADPPWQARRPRGPRARGRAERRRRAHRGRRRDGRSAPRDPRRAAGARLAAGLLAGAAQGQGEAARSAHPGHADQGRPRSTIARSGARRG